MRVEFLARNDRRGGLASWILDGLPGQTTITGFKTFCAASVPNRGMERIGGANSAKIFGERGRNDLPMGAAIGGQENGSDASNNPAHLIGGSGTGEQIGEDAAGLAGPGGTAILGELNEAGAPDAPDEV